MTCRGSRRNTVDKAKNIYEDSPEWLEQNMRSTRNFIRKWGHFVKHDEYMKPIVHPVYHTTFVIQKCTKDLLTLLEPWCDLMYVDLEITTILDYISNEQPKTTTDLTSKVLYNNNSIKGKDVVVELDGSQLHQNNFQYIPLLSQIISDSGQVDSKQKLDIFNVTIIKKEDLKSTR